jgi:hypothetical protein
VRAALPAAIAAMLLAGAAQLEGQEHPEPAKAAHPEPVKAAPPAPTVVPPKARNVNVTPTIPAAKVAAAVAEAMRQAEEAAARRKARITVRPSTTARMITTAPVNVRRYEVQWPAQRMVVQWPAAAPADGRVRLTWPAF